MKVKFNGKEIELRYSLRIFIIYENLMDGSEIKDDYLSLITLLYSTLVATLQYKREPINIDYQSFIDWIDDNGGIGLITEFTKWFNAQSATQMNLIGQPEDKQDEKEESVLDRRLKKS